MWNVYNLEVMYNHINYIVIYWYKSSTTYCGCNFFHLLQRKKNKVREEDILNIDVSFDLINKKWQPLLFILTKCLVRKLWPLIIVIVWIFNEKKKNTRRKADHINLYSIRSHYFYCNCHLSHLNKLDYHLEGEKGLFCVSYLL